MGKINLNLKSDLSNKKINALFDAFELGTEGIELIALALQDKNREVRQTALFLLSESNLESAKYALSDYSMLSKFACLSTSTGFKQVFDYYEFKYPEYFAIADLYDLLITYWNSSRGNWIQTYSLINGKKSNFRSLPSGHTDEVRLGLNGKYIIISYQHHYEILYTDGLKNTNKYNSWGGVSNIFLQPEAGCFSVAKNKDTLMVSGTDYYKELEIKNYDTCSSVFKYKFNRYETLLVDRDLYPGLNKNDNYLISPLRLTPNGDFLVVRFGDFINKNEFTIKIWNTATKKLIQTIENLPRLTITSLGVNPEHQIIACGIRNNKTYVWELKTDSIIYTVNEIAPCILSDDGRILIYATVNYEIVIVDLVSKKTLNILQGHTAPIIYLALSGDREFLASYSEAMVIKIWGISQP